MMETFTVLGGKGYIGQALIQGLTGLGHIVNNPERHDILFGGKDMGHVIYAIGLTSDYSSRPFDTVTAHVELLNHVLQFGKFSSLLYLSSTRLYDGTQVGKEEQILHLDPLNPRHIYDLSKAMGEALCHQSERENVRVARLANVYGGELNGDGFIHFLIRLLGGKGPLNINNNPYLVRDYIHIHDVILALKLISTSGTYQVYNVASGVNVSNQIIAKLVSDASGREINFNYDYHKSFNIMKCPIIDVSRLNELGIKSKSIHEKISDILESVILPY